MTQTPSSPIVAWLQEGVARHQAGDVRGAEALYDEVLKFAPTNVDALNLKGIIAADGGRHEDAVALFAHAIAADPRAVDPRLNRGRSFEALRRNDDALADYTEILRAVPHHAEAHFHLGSLLEVVGRGEEARAAFRVMSEYCPRDHRGFYNLAVYALRAGDLAHAAAMAAHASALNPNWPAALGLRAEIAFGAGDFEHAETLAHEALVLDSSLAAAHRVLGGTLMRTFRYDGAVEHYKCALAADAQNAELRSNFALLLARMGRHEEAAAQYRLALRHNPNNPEACYGLGLAMLALGRLDEGWPLYAWRLVSRVPERDPASRPVTCAPPQADQRLTLMSDQGLGEQIMFASLIPDLLKVTRNIEIRCEPRLIRLFGRSFPEVRFVPYKNASDGISGAVTDTARWLRPTLATFPRHKGYLKIDAERRDAFRKRYRAPSGTRLVGLSWRTGKGYKFADHKSIPLPRWQGILSVPHTKFVSLQYGDATDAVDDVNKTLGEKIIRDAAVDPINDFDAFAAQVAAMDFVITTSNTTAHVAGALNVPTLVLVPLGFGGLWHWFLDRDDSPWYPSIRLVRQTKAGEWDEVLERAAAALSAFTTDPSTRPNGT